MKKVQRALQKLVHGGNAYEYERAENEEVQVPSDVPVGSLVVYVGEDGEGWRRFVIKAKILKHETFHVLLEKSAEELGYKHDIDGLVILCEVAFFQHLVLLIETKSPSLCRMHLRDYWAFAPDNTTCHMGYPSSKDVVEIAESLYSAVKSVVIFNVKLVVNLLLIPQ